MTYKPPQNSANRIPLDEGLFEMRNDRVKWPTIRRAWLTNESVAALNRYAVTKARSIIFLDGTYATNLNDWVKKDPIERAVFFECLAKHPRVKGGIFALAWIGNFHNGCIFHCAWQYPQVRCWHTLGVGVESFFERKAFELYKDVVTILYEHSDEPMDDEVREFINQ